MTNFSLAHLTVLSLAPADMVAVAARTGYQAVGLRLIAVTSETPGYPLMSDPPAMRATRALLRDTGIGVNDIEFVRLTPELDVRSLEPFVAAGAELGARHVIAAPYDPDPGRLAARLAQLGDLADGYGLSVVLEFFPWTIVPDVATAARIVAATDRSNVGILLDTLHVARSNSSLDDIAGLSPSLFPFVHVCDAPAGSSFTTEQLLVTARAERLPPGEGDLDIQGLLGRLPAGIPIGLEVPMERLTRAHGPEYVARRVREAAARVFG